MFFQVILPVTFSGIQSLTAHATDDEMKKQITEFYNRVAGVFGFEVNCKTSEWYTLKTYSMLVILLVLLLCISIIKYIVSFGDEMSLKPLGP